jgi:hypothetical protein
MTYRIASCWLLAASFLCPTSPAYSATSEGCVPGVYLVREGSGTQSLWSFSSDGTVHSTSSAQGALGFGDGYGGWKQERGKLVKSTFLDFSYRPSAVEGGFPPAAVARVDAVSSFTKHCSEIHGSFELRFFDPATEDPLERTTDTGQPITETFTGRRVAPQ